MLEHTSYFTVLLDHDFCFDLILESLFNSRRRSSPNLLIHARGDVLAMLTEMAHEQGIRIEDLAMRFVEKNDQTISINKC